MWGLGFRVWGVGFRVWGLGFWVWGLGFREKCEAYSGVHFVNIRAAWGVPVQDSGIIVKTTRWAFEKLLHKGCFLHPILCHPKPQTLNP